VHADISGTVPLNVGAQILRRDRIRLERMNRCSPNECEVEDVIANVRSDIEDDRGSLCELPERS
jgi:hypothetical protein